jgi:hypothetical protein
MNKSSIAAGAFLAAAIGALAPSSAEAQSRLYFNYEPEYRTYYPGPLYAPRPRYFYYYDYDPEPPYAYDYEPEYYEPEYQPRRQYQRPVRPYKARKQRQQQQDVVTYDEQEAKEIAPEPVKKPKPVEKKAAGMSCDKAAKIVAEYGFKSVKASSCKGSVYSFKGSRDGKSYSIKLSSKSGELTEVKKL